MPDANEEEQRRQYQEFLEYKKDIEEKFTKAMFDEYYTRFEDQVKKGQVNHDKLRNNLIKLVTDAPELSPQLPKDVNPLIRDYVKNFNPIAADIADSVGKYYKKHTHKIMGDYTLFDPKKALKEVNNAREAKHYKEVKRCISKAHEGKNIAPREFSSLTPKEVDFYKKEAKLINKDKKQSFASIFAKIAGKLGIKSAEDYIQYKINKPKVKDMIKAFSKATAVGNFIHKSSGKSNDRGTR